MNYEAAINTLCSLCRKDKTCIDDFINHGTFNKNDFIMLIKSFVGIDGNIYFEHGYNVQIYFDKNKWKVMSFDYNTITCFNIDKEKRIYRYENLSFSILIGLLKNIFYYYNFCVNR